MRANPGRHSALLVVNPRAGSVTDGWVEQVQDCCSACFAELRRVDTDGPGAAVEQVAEAVRVCTLDVVIAMGGDGTVREVVEGVLFGAKRGCADPRVQDKVAPPIAVIPAGSGNSAFSLLWGDLSWREALEPLACGAGQVRGVDLIRVCETNRVALLGVNFGLVARVAHVIEEMKAAGLGEHSREERYWTAFGEVLQDLRPFPVRVAVDGELLYAGMASMITVGGVRSFGRGTFRLLPRSVVDDGLLDTCVVTAQTPEQIGALAALVTRGGHVGQPGVLYAQGRRVSVMRTDGRGLSVEHDGDPRVSGGELNLEVVPSAVKFLAAETSVTERG
jgi:diacylglycerol kinase (ATP)